MARHVLLLIGVFLVTGCDAGGDPCVAGASAACTCSSGLSGAQVCLGDGSGFGACVCDSGTGTADVAGGPDGHLADVVVGGDTGRGGEVTPDGDAPKLAISPSSVIFDDVPLGGLATRELVLTNYGGGSLQIAHLGFVGSGQFGVEIGAETFSPVGTVFLAEPLSISAGETRTVEVAFAPSYTGPAQATLTFYSNDPAEQQGQKVLLFAGQPSPCLRVLPNPVGFGTVALAAGGERTVSLANCGAGPVEVTSIGLDAASTSAAFSLGAGLSGGGAWPSVQSPLVLSSGGDAALTIRYSPTTASAEVAGALVPDKGVLTVESNAAADPLEVTITGLAVDVDGPQAVLTLEEATQVAPQAVLHLHGSGSFAPAGPIGSWEWTAVQPVGSQSVFVPSATVPDPTFEANVAGTYQFELIVRDALGQASVPAMITVVAVPDEAIHVELLWETPNDPDETNEGPEAGADLDLHFAHQSASGPDLDGDGVDDGWFHQPFDCFWFNPNPNWASFDPAIDDDPGLDRDDTDGAGPENLNLNIPEDGQTYRIGVHYWHDHKFGPSYATLRVYIWGELVWERAGVKLLNHDLWEAATIEWPSGVVTPVEWKGGDKITPNYENPFFFQP